MAGSSCWHGLTGLQAGEDAEAIKGMSLYIARDALPETATDEVYQIDLIGCSVEQRDRYHWHGYRCLRFWCRDNA